MSLQLDTDIRNDLLDGIDSVFDSGTLEIRSGAQPANADAAASGTILASITLPADAFAAAGSGTKVKAGTWEDTSADNSGTAGHFRLKNGADSRRIDGDITVTSGGGVLELDSLSITAGQTVTISTFTLNMPAT